ncbi:hypothetical protein AAMO2058_000315600 [Amorphochlora amoebiformis]
MSDFDSLAFSGLRRSHDTFRRTFCPQCRAITLVDTEMDACDDCGHEFPRPSSVDSESIRNQVRDESLQQHPLISAIGSLIQANGSGRNELQRAVEASLQAQRDRINPTAKSFLDSLQELPIQPSHFFPIILRVPTLRKDLRCCPAKFGLDIYSTCVGSDNKKKEKEVKISAGSDDKKKKKEVKKSAGGVDGKRVLTKAKLQIAQPIHGEKAIENDMKGKICVFRRGKVSFADKVKRAQKAGAIAVIVIQSKEGGWPYTMTDSTDTTKGVSIPILMISYADGENLLKSQKSAKESIIFGVSVSLTCSVCRDDFEMGEEALGLPCGHFFHSHCIRPWIVKKNVCPMCRYELPAAKRKSPADMAVLQAHAAQRRADMYQ